MVEFYIYEQANSLLKRIPIRGGNGKRLPTCPLGRGLVGRAASDEVITTMEYFNRQQGNEGKRVAGEENLWMAAPIIFEKRLLGVIGIGKPKLLDGANHLLRIIAEIAAVALYNQLFLTDAKQKAETDPLTGLYNRRYFHQISRKFVEKAITDQTPISVFLFDIDHFKQYNDANGHEEGDKLLMELSELVQEYTRKTSVVARYGGEEFIVLLPGIPAADAFKYAERLREAIASHPFPHRESQPFEFLSISGGIASFPDHERSIQGVIRLADEALYKAKESGRNRVTVHNSSLTSEKERAAASFWRGFRGHPVRPVFPDHSVEVPGEQLREVVQPAAEEEVPSDRSGRQQKEEEVRQGPAGPCPFAARAGRRRLGLQDRRLFIRLQEAVDLLHDSIRAHPVAPSSGHQHPRQQVLNLQGEGKEPVVRHEVVPLPPRQGSGQHLIEDDSRCEDVGPDRFRVTRQGIACFAVPHVRRARNRRSSPALIR